MSTSSVILSSVHTCSLIQNNVCLPSSCHVHVSERICQQLPETRSVTGHQSQSSISIKPYQQALQQSNNAWQSKAMRKPEIPGIMNKTRIDNHTYKKDSGDLNEGHY